MCGRYVFYDEKNQYLRNLIAQAKEHYPEKEFEKISLFDVYPSQSALVGILNQTSKQMVIRRMVWGYPLGKKQIINARSETCFSSKMFQDSFPCVIPASSYYEWSKNKQKFRFYTESETIYLAGLAKKIDEEWHFVILTEQATGLQAIVHSRQPIVFNRDNAKKWCMNASTSMFQYSIQNRFQQKSE